MIDRRDLKTGFWIGLGLALALLVLGAARWLLTALRGGHG